MKLTGDEAREVVWCESEDWQEIESKAVKVVGNGRWSIHREEIFEYIPTNKYYKFKWITVATEYQDEEPFQYQKEVTPVEVRKVTKMVEVWEEINA